MGMSHIGLVHHGFCGCKIKNFHAIFSYERKVQRGTYKETISNEVYIGMCF